MGIDVTHLVFETLGNTDDEVVDESLDGAERSHVFASAMVKFDDDLILSPVRKADCQVLHVLH